jgi:hypothetical protein
VLGVHCYSAPEYLCGIDGTFSRILFVVLEFPELRRGELLKYGMHLAEEEAVFAVQETETEEVPIEERQKGAARQMRPNSLLDKTLTL